MTTVSLPENGDMIGQRLPDFDVLRPQFAPRATSAYYFSRLGESIRVAGVELADFDANGVPASGVVTGFWIYTGGLELMLGIDNIAMPAADFFELLPDLTWDRIVEVFMAGIDFLSGGAGDDTLRGGDGHDTIYDYTGRNYLRGDGGDDYISGGDGFDDINGNMGRDTIHGGLGDDWVVGGKDDDRLHGEQGNDLIYGNIGADTCDGEDGADTLRGGQDADTISGGNGDDWLFGDRGSDDLSGGNGADIFNLSTGYGLDRVSDFSAAQGDRVRVEGRADFTVQQVGFDVVVDLGAGDQLVLSRVTLASLPPGWIFAV